MPMSISMPQTATTEPHRSKLSEQTSETTLQSLLNNTRNTSSTSGSNTNSSNKRSVTVSTVNKSKRKKSGTDTNANSKTSYKSVPDPPQPVLQCLFDKKACAKLGQNALNLWKIIHELYDLIVAFNEWFKNSKKRKNDLTTLLKAQGYTKDFLRGKLGDLLLPPILETFDEYDLPAELLEQGAGADETEGDSDEDEDGDPSQNGDPSQEDWNPVMVD